MYYYFSVSREKENDLKALIPNYSQLFFESVTDKTSLDLYKHKDDPIRKKSKKYSVIKSTSLDWKALNNFKKDMTSKNIGYLYDDITPVLRFLIDTDIKSMGWVNLENYKPCKSFVNKAESYSIIECKFNDLEPIEDVSMADIGILSFDIECDNTGDHFPSPDNDKVIQIGCSYERLDTNVTENMMFVLGTCDPIEDVELCTFETESKMLQTWCEYVVSKSPNILTGYNINMFDIKYLLERSHVLGVSLNFGHLGVEVQKKQTYKKSNQKGGVENIEISAPGIIVFDMFKYVRDNFNLASYKLNAISEHFIGDRKNDLGYNEIGPLFRGSSSDRAEIARYCIKDAILPLAIGKKILSFKELISMCRITGLIPSEIINRGQQARVYACIVKEATKNNFIVPERRGKRSVFSDKSTAEEYEYEGARVIEPQIGYIANPVVVLDFEAMYPSIVISHNLCYSTRIENTDHLEYLLDSGKINEDDYITTPSGDLFVKPHIRKGILPTILNNLLTQRRIIKGNMKAASIAGDFELAEVYNSLQKSVKIVANSGYGFTGSNISPLGCPEIARSITAIGRQAIDNTKYIVETEFDGSNVVYGDTDSVMVEFKCSLDIAFTYGEQMANRINDFFDGKLKIVLEKVFLPYLLKMKKKYAGVLYSDPNKKGVLKVNGLECVRRDNARVVGESMKRWLEILMIEKDPDGALKFVREILDNIVNGKINMSQLINTGGMKARYEDYTSPPPHVILAKKIELRNNGNGPKPGDRIPYIIISGDGAVSTRCEDPLYAMENDYAISKEYYSSAFKNSFNGILEIVYKQQNVLGHQIVADECNHCPLDKFLIKTLNCTICDIPNIRSKYNDVAVCEYCANNKLYEVMIHNLSSDLENNLKMCYELCNKSETDKECFDIMCDRIYDRIKYRIRISRIQDCADSWSSP
jgi:DNA polymerase delta subunit 1